jgi:transposase
MAGKRRRYSAEFKAKVALEALKDELTIARLVARYGVHQTLISSWKRQAMDGMAGRRQQTLSQRRGTRRLPSGRPAP